MATIKLRRGTSAQWAAANPILADGEVGIESSPGVVPDKGKIGDGLTVWNSLPYSIDSDWVPISQKGIAGGVATLDGSGLVPLAQLPNQPETFLQRITVQPVTDQVALTVKGESSQTANLQEWQDSSSAILSTISENGYYTTRKTTAPADAELVAGELAFWFDQTNGAAKLMVKAKQADGTVRTGSLPLT